MNKFGLLAVALAIFTTACARAPAPAPEPWRPVSFGMVKTEGVIIEAEKGDFVLRSGERFETPFDDGAAWITWPSLTEGKAFTAADSDCDSRCKKLRLKGAMPTATAYRGCDSKCRKVRVTVPGESDKLYGILHFARMHPDTRGPGTRSYLIEIPRRYVDEARDGRVSVVYETVTRVDNKTQTGWTLWLSDMPFSDCGDPC